MSDVAEWKTRKHLEDHYVFHGREFPGATLDEYAASARETLDVGVYFT